MRIKFLVDAEYKQDTPETSRSYKAGETYDVTDDHGNRWIRRNMAEEVPVEKRRAPERMVPVTKPEKV